jgi:NitT/TauT family transport system permease protein
MSKWQKFWRLELPYSIPPLVWNMVLSMSGGWFFVVACEVITVGDNHLTLPGLGSYISLALEQKDTIAILAGVLAMSLVILVYDQLLIRPLVVWSDKFRYEMNSGQGSPRSWVLSLFYKSTLIKFLSYPLKAISKFIVFCPIFNRKSFEAAGKPDAKPSVCRHIIYYSWYAMLLGLGLFASCQLFEYFDKNTQWSEVVHVFNLTLITLLRVIVLIIIASVIWVPIGIYIGSSPKWTAIAQPAIQFLAAFPVNLFFPVAVIAITHFDLNPDIWLSLLMIFGTQWFILFNVVAGVAMYPNELKEAAKNLNIKGLLWWKKIMLPAIMPWFLIGAVTACGSAWNTSILAEVVSYGDTKIVAAGIGSYIAENTVKADFHKIILGIAMMSFFVVTINRFFWNPLLHIVNKKYNLN